MNPKGIVFSKCDPKKYNKIDSKIHWNLVHY